MTTVLGVNDVVHLHDDMVAKTGGSLGIRDQSALESAVNTPLMCFGSIELYATIELKAAALVSYLARDHCFIDGNKRTAAIAMLVFLDTNGAEIYCEQSELVKLMLDIANNRLTIQQIAEWIKAHERR